MSKTTAFWLLMTNLIFLVINIMFMMVGSFPTVNFIAAMMTLGGAISSYLLYVDADR